MSGMFIPIVIIGFALVLVGLVALVARRWTKCAPNEVLVVYGRKRYEYRTKTTIARQRRSKTVLF